MNHSQTSYRPGLRRGLRQFPGYFSGLVALAVLLALPQAGCTHRAGETEAQGDEVKVDRGPSGTEVELRQDLDHLADQAAESGREAGAEAREAGRQLGQEAREAGKALEEGARDLSARVAPAARQAGQALEEGARRVGEQMQPVLSDAGVTARVKARLLADPEVNAFHVDVDTVNGVVTLNGEVASQAIKDEAEKLARQTEGVKQVNNVIQVLGKPAGKPGR